MLMFIYTRRELFAWENNTNHSGVRTRKKGQENRLLIAPGWFKTHVQNQAILRGPKIYNAFANAYPNQNFMTTKVGEYKIKSKAFAKLGGRRKET